MQNLKIRIPCEEVSKLVQEKAFERGGFWWPHKQRYVQFSEKPFLFLNSEGCFTYLDDDREFFNNQPHEEFSWQEWVFGEGYFFMFEHDDRLFFQAKSNNEIYYVCVDNDVRSLKKYSYKQHMRYSGWYETDMFGNKLEVKEMKEEVKLYDDKISIELTAEDVAKLRILLGESYNYGFHKIYQTLCSVLPVSKRKYLGSVDACINSVTDFNIEVESVLQNNGYVKEAPKPVKEMTLADVCKELGYDIKIIKD